MVEESTRRARVWAVGVGVGGESDDMSPTTDWSAWHADYADPTSLLSERLRVVQRHIHHWLDDRPQTL